MADAQEHFTPVGESTATAPGRFVDVSRIPEVQFVEGLGFRPVLGEATMLNFVSFEPGTLAPRHAHEEEQIVLVLEGELQFDLDGEVRTMGRGDVAVVPPWVPHAAWTGETGCREVDVFNPPRRSLLEHARKHQALEA
ncbi:MAG: cupin domain-containing protein [Acidimicrobiales bacterium]